MNKTNKERKNERNEKKRFGKGCVRPLRLNRLWMWVDQNFVDMFNGRWVRLQCILLSDMRAKQTIHEFTTFNWIEALTFSPTIIPKLQYLTSKHAFQFYRYWFIREVFFILFLSFISHKMHNKRKWKRQKLLIISFETFDEQNRNT